jgi:hydrogenase/urease accessory protein HupE
MKTLLPRRTALTTALLLLSPTMLAAHGGHAGDHGWLVGAAQPWLSVDHFLAGLFIAVVGALGMAALSRHTRAGGVPRT